MGGSERTLSFHPDEWYGFGKDRTRLRKEALAEARLLSRKNNWRVRIILKDKFSKVVIATVDCRHWLHTNEAEEDFRQNREYRKWELATIERLHLENVERAGPAAKARLAAEKAKRMVRRSHTKKLGPPGFMFEG